MFFINSECFPYFNYFYQAVRKSSKIQKMCSNIQEVLPENDSWCNTHYSLPGHCIR